MARISDHTITTAVTNAMLSAIGAAYRIPLIPKMVGKKNISGSKKMICLVRDRNVPLLALPMEVKNVEEIGCIKFAHAINIKIRK